MIIQPLNGAKSPMKAPTYKAHQKAIWRKFTIRGFNDSD
jgi:hypothetical protein